MERSVGIGYHLQSDYKLLKIWLKEITKPQLEEYEEGFWKDKELTHQIFRLKDAIITKSVKYYIKRDKGTRGDYHKN